MPESWCFKKSFNFLLSFGKHFQLSHSIFLKEPWLMISSLKRDWDNRISCFPPVLPSLLNTILLSFRLQNRSLKNSTMKKVVKPSIESKALIRYWLSLVISINKYYAVVSPKNKTNWKVSNFYCLSYVFTVITH